ncbi:MAG: Holliday junction branch migration protein RuvA [Syntrophomonadaceae bacterium]|jgi:Holliday junction DNA helicase RuvA|nr:Holliday junction branch migration protein RuvA [Bacillota bacterium]NLM88979.1 Holliday junction branch migration protein RuvA [Syntrophomonadaceae bacterium]HAA09322.1 Holliday junction branch migration protein RuvA [Syntrophomonas sp.]HQA49866.1 Holliday junction branch migration protein RuvA [Syntrophomonadaceae bacterium]HQD89700.1 Holliday junction branch migration protein RuvA [Syntrophomonadaceae bacterium]
MIDYLRGTLTDIRTESVILEVNGVGYELAVPDRYMASLPPAGEQMRFFTYLQVLDNEFKLYGFFSREEQSLFKTLLGVSGIGARGALNILGTMGPSQFYAAIASEDEKQLQKTPGIGKKTAQRLLFELKDKLPSDMIISAGTSEPGMIGQVLEALEVLGFSRNEVFPILRELKETGQLSQRVEDNVKLVLKRNAEKTNR